MQKKFSYPLKIDELNQNEYKYVIAANKDELADITSILQVEDVKNLTADLRLKLNLREHVLRVWGTVTAQIELKSVISLENFIKPYAITFEKIYDTQASYEDLKEIDDDIYSEVPELVENGTIDLADIIIEQIAINLDDHPRAEGEVFDFSAYQTQEDTIMEESPFAILKRLKK